MADKNTNSYLIGILFGTRRFLGALITNPSSKFRNSKRRIQYGGPKCKKILDWNEIWYLEVFEVADYESKRCILKFKIAVPMWLIKMQRVTRLGWKLVFWGFWGRWLRIRAQDLKIKDGGSDMADKNVESYSNEIKFGTRRFLGSLITNPSSTLKNSAWRIQDGWLKCKKLLNCGEIWYSGFFGIADYESELNIQKFKMPHGRRK